MSNNIESRETKETNPIYLPSTVSLDMFFATNRQKDYLGDFEAYKQKIRQSDIFIPEMLVTETSGATANALSVYNRISKGNKGLFEEQQDLWFRTTGNRAFAAPYTLGVYEALFDSQKPVLFVDLPQGGPLEHQVRPSILPSDFYTGDLDEASSKHIRHIEQVAKGNVIRDKFISENIGPELDKIIKANPELSEKKQVDVFMTINTVHKPVFNDIDNATQVQRNTTSKGLPKVTADEPPIQYSDPATELTYHFDPRSTVTKSESDVKLLGEQAVILHLVGHHLNNGSLDYNALSSAVTELSRRERQEIYDYYEKWNRTRLVVNKPTALNTVLELHNMFKADGI